MSNFYLWGTGVLLSTIALFTTPSTGNPGTTENVTPGDYSTTAAILNHTSKNRSAFIDAISKAEGTSGEDGYYKNFGGEIIRNVGKEHPEKCVQFFNRQTGRTDCSTAFGKGQFLNKTWKRVVKEFPDDINDISNPDHQRKAFFAVIWTEGKDPETTLKMIDEGNPDAMYRVCKIWASVPCSNGQGAYNQPLDHDVKENFVKQTIQNK